MHSDQPDMARILIADDELTFLNSTADLLRGEGYQCTCAPDAATAAKMLNSNRYDLLIADIKMPGNPELELIQELPRVSQGIPVILVTGYPSFKSALKSIRLPVFSYVVKPVDFETLLAEVRAALNNQLAYDMIVDARKRLEKLGKELLDAYERMKETSAGTTSNLLDTHIEILIRNIIDTLTNLGNLSETHSVGNDQQGACRLVNCPPEIVLTEVLEQMSGMMKKIKRNFASKELFMLQKRFDDLFDSDNSSRKSA